MSTAVQPVVHTQGAAHAEKNGIKVIFNHPIVNQQGAAMGIHIGPGIFYFAK